MSIFNNITGRQTDKHIKKNKFTKKNKFLHKKFNKKMLVRHTK